jgi:hypothetical protein
LQCVYSNDPAIERIAADNLPFDETNCIPHDAILFSDKSFNGTTRQFIISAESRSLESGVDQQGNLARPYLKRYSISEDYYQYLKLTLSMYSGGDLPSLNNPVAVKGNVKNGYGLFAVYSVTVDSLR